MQSNSIFAAVGIAFMIYITMRGELPRYMGLLIGQGAASASPTDAAMNANNVLNIALPALGGLAGFEL